VTDDEVDAALREIWTRHREGVVGRVAVLERAVTALIDGHLDDELRHEAERAAHTLAGSLGTFGFMRASERARELELAFEARDALGPGQVPTLSELVLDLENELGDEPARSPERAAAPKGAGSFLVVARDAELGERLTAEAAARGLRVERAESVDGARAAVARHRPDVALLDLDLPEGAVQVHDLLSELTDGAPPVSVLALTAAGSFTDRVEVARRGGRGFVVASRPAGAVIDRVEQLIERLRAQRTTVLAVDDDPALLDALRATLGAHGLEVVALQAPLGLWDALRDARPDLLVLDLDMPGVNGIELCRVVRNEPRWAALPVLVLTAHGDRATAEEVFAAGADDLVVKPVAGTELTTRIRNRLERAQVLRDAAGVDPLSGVAARSRTAEHLVQLARLADRFGEPLSLAVLTLDDASDEEALRGLGRRLLRTFRGEDVVGRGGSSQFVVGMFGMQRHDGVGRVADVLEAFRGDLRATFSAGVAEAPADGPDLRTLQLAADDALDRARATGGNRVVPAGDEGAADVDTVDVAIVEDDRPTAQLLLHALQTRGYRTRWLRDGHAAAQALGGARPALRSRLVVLDVDLPGVDGLAVLRFLAAGGALRRTRIIMLTARAAEAEVVQALELGAADHVGKPFSVPVLMQKVRRALEG